MEYKTINPALTVYFGFRSPGICLRVSNALTYFTPNPIGYFLRKNPGVAATKTLIEKGIYIYIVKIYISISLHIHIYIYFYISYIFSIYVYDYFWEQHIIALGGKSTEWKCSRKCSRSEVKAKVPERFISFFLPTNLFFPVASWYWRTNRFLASPFRNFSLPVEKTLIRGVLAHKLDRFGHRCP